MANIIYNDSAFRFTEPVRFFKSNDPYYFEVDNIPLKQLQENCLWLRDQLGIGTKGEKGEAGATGAQGAAGQGGIATEIKRESFDELRPFANGGDRIVRVKPGRYSARINNVSEKEKLGYLAQVLGKGTGSPYAGEIGVGDEYEGAILSPDFGQGPPLGGAGGENNPLLEATLEKFKTNIKINGLGMGGLEERAFTWPVKSAKWPFDEDGVDIKETGTGLNFYGGDQENMNGIWNVPMPIHQALMWARQADGVLDPNYDLLYNWRLQSTGFGQLPYNESYWVKRWRGITKISIVDVPTELEISVPDWKSDDFFYINEEKQKTQIDGVASRIDLVFIYSKPIDATGITIWKQGFPQKINTPQLGIVKGAGIGVPFNNFGGDEDLVAADITINEGNKLKMNPWGAAQGAHPQILPSAGDQNREAHTYGFLAASGSDVAQDVVGSFPSPDDIMNLAPLICNQLEENAVELVGQSILPVAYIFVQDNGSFTVEPQDIIDIRPFFRTTELAYNERAGIAAAMPQLSLANPAVGKAELTQALGEVKDLIPDAYDPGTNAYNMNVVAAGQVYGGWFYGPEAALVDFQGRHVTNGKTLQENREAVCATYGYPVDTNQAVGTQSFFDVPEYPDWDIAPWCEIKFTNEPGYHVNDRINTFTPWGGTDGIPGANSKGDEEVTNHSPAGGFEQGIKGSSYRYSNIGGNVNSPTGTKAGTLGDDTKADHGQIKYFNMGLNEANCFNFISKLYRFTRPPGMYDYNVDVTFLNCLPMTFGGGSGDQKHAPEEAPQYAGVIWVEKGHDYFVIYVSTSINKSVTKVTSTQTEIQPQFLPMTNRDSGDMFSNFFVPTKSILNTINTTHPAIGDNWHGQPGIGLCTYPSVSWKMTEIPAPRPLNYNTAAGGNSFKSFYQETGTYIGVTQGL